MKQTKFRMSLYLAAAAVLAGLGLTGCGTDEESRHHFDNKLFINTTAQTSSILFEAGSEAVEERTLTIGTAIPVETEVKARFVYDAAYADTYNRSYNATATALPAEMVAIQDAEVAIQSGSVTSAPATVVFSGLENLNRETIYVAPVRLVDVEGIDVLNSKTTVYYVFRGAALINVVAGIAENCAWPEWKDPSPVTNMSQFTLETLVNCSRFGKLISTIMGIEGVFLVRIGDSGVPDNQIQIATSRGNFTNADLQLETDRWYHVAVTFDAGALKVYIDGVERLSESTGLSSVNFGVAHSDESNNQPRCFWVGYSYDDARYLEGYVSELRIWNKPLTADEINATNHFYRVSPDSEGLVGYWKFNEGAGTTVKDQTAYGNDMTIQTVPDWKAVTLPE